MEQKMPQDFCTFLQSPYEKCAYNITIKTKNIKHKPRWLCVNRTVHCFDEEKEFQFQFQ